MADQKITDGVSITSTASTDVLDISQDQGGGIFLTKKITAENLIKPAQDAADQAASDAAAAVIVADDAATDAANAQSTANDAISDASDAQDTADQAIIDAGDAQTDATQALSDASDAQDDATQALTDASTAQGTADAALPKAGGLMAGNIDMGGNALTNFGAEQFKSFTVPANALTPRTTDGPGISSTETSSNNVMVDSLDFDDLVSEGAQFQFEMPDDWDLGTVKAKIRWAGDSGTGTVKWDLRAVALADSDPFDSAFGTAVTITDTLTTAEDSQQTDATPSMTIAGTPALGDLVVFEISRDPSGDTLTADARLVAISIQYKTLQSVVAEW